MRGKTRGALHLNNTALNCESLLSCRCFPINNVLQNQDPQLVESMDAGPGCCRHVDAEGRL